MIESRKVSKIYTMIPLYQQFILKISNLNNCLMRIMVVKSVVKIVLLVSFFKKIGRTINILGEKYLSKLSF